MVNNKRIFRNIDKKLFLNLIIIVSYGLVALKSASLSLNSANRIMKAQIVSTIIGFGALAFLVMIDYRIWRKFAKPIYIISVALLLATLLFGDSSKGAKSWITIPIIKFRFQPSEFAKVGIVISMAAYLSKYGNRINEPKILIRVIALAIVPIALVYVQPDAGTAIVYGFMIAFMVFYSGISLRSVILIGLIILLLLPFMWISLKPHQKNRILSFLDPSSNTQSTSYQANQGIIATGSGKFFGKGLFKGNQNQFGFIPEKHNDFIFPTLVEELGFVGGILAILLYGNLLIRIFKTALKSRDSFGGYIVVGLGAMLLFHIFQNIAMTIGIMPITGIPLPFFSSGGSFQLINLAVMGLILSVSAHNKKKIV